jgi:hypothetical protein
MMMCQGHATFLGPVSYQERLPLVSSCDAPDWRRLSPTHTQRLGAP